jgi:predicted negative regulator of RcsB-dependent stress response
MEGRYLLQLGDTLLESGRTAEAREAFGQCAALGPDAGADQIAEARSRLGGQDAG